MATRIIFLSFFALLCFAVTGSVHLSQGFAAEAGIGQADTPSDQGIGAGHGHAVKNQALKEQLMKLPPAQRKAKIEELKQQVTAEKAQKLQQRKDEFQGKWDKATPEQRAKFCTNVKQKCADGGKKFACEIAQSKCSAGQ